jgi:hypothetical protein
MTFAKGHKHEHVRLELDNTTAVSYVNKQGGRIEELYHIALATWQYAIARDIWLSAAHLPGVLNIQADAASRDMFKYDKEWQLEPVMFAKIQQEIGINDVDLFASRINAQMDTYVSWHPDPGAIAIDAFSLDWSLHNAFIFPPFSVLGRTVQKLVHDRARATVIAPVWPAQAWYPVLLRLSTHTPRLLRHPHLLRLPHRPGATHPLMPKIKIAAFAVSGALSSNRESPLGPEPLFWPLGV